MVVVTTSDVHLRLGSIRQGDTRQVHTKPCAHTHTQTEGWRKERLLQAGATLSVADSHSVTCSSRGHCLACGTQQPVMGMSRQNMHLV